MEKKKTSAFLKAGWKKLLHGLAVLGIPVLMLPVIYLGNAVSVADGFTAVDPPFGRTMLFFAENLLGGLICALLCLLADRIRQKDEDNARFALFANILMGAGLVLELAVFAILHFAPDAPFFVGAAALVTTYILVWKRSGKGYGEVLNQKMLTAYCVIAVIVVVVFWGMKVEYSRMSMVWGLFYLAGIYALTQNQSNIDFMMARRKHKMEHLPGVVRKRSFVLTLLVVAVILLCVLLTPQIAWLFESLVQGLGMLALSVIRFIFSLFPDSEPSEYVEETPAGDGGGMGGFGGSEEGSPWWNYIMWPLIITVALWLLYTYRDSIMRWFITLVRTFKSKVKGALFAKPKRTRMGGDGEGDYEDEVVELSASEVKEERRRDGFRLRDWKKSLRAFRAMPDGDHKYREGYRLALQWLVWKKVPVEPSDTPLAVLEKAKKLLPEDDWAAVTDWYNYIRYGDPESFPRESLPVLEKALGFMEKGKVNG